MNKKILLEKLLFEQQIDEPEITGEYWIDDSGSLMFADGDVGDYNHEAHVINIIHSNIMDFLKDSNNEESISDYLADDENVLKVEQILGIETDEDEKQKFYDDPEQYIYDYMIANNIEIQGIPPKVAIATIGSFSSVDARDIAMKYWGWKRVAGNNVQTWRISAKDLRLIGDGVSEIIESEGTYEMMDSEDEFDQLMKITIEVLGMGKHMIFYNVPLAVIDQHNTSLLNDFVNL